MVEAGWSVFLYFAGLLCILAGLAGLLLPAVPGAPLVYAGIVLVAWADGFERIGAGTLVITGLLAALVSAVDYLAQSLGSRSLGGSWWAALGAFLGLLAGLPFGLLGIFVGPLVGAVLLEYLQDPDFRRAARSGAGTLAGFLVGVVVKYALTLVMLGIALVAYVF